MACASKHVSAFAFGTTWHHLSLCESTNDELVRLGRTGVGAGTVVTADAQTRGRGRQGRAWHSPPGENLYLSVLLRPPLAPHRAPLLCLAAGLALFDAVTDLLSEHGGRDAVDLRLKWPNDLLARTKTEAQAGAPYRKLGGILTELFGSAGSIDFVVIGVGCNVASRSFPSGVPGTSLELLYPPLSLAATPRAPLTRSLAERFLAALAAWYERYLSDGNEAITAPFAAAAGLGPEHPLLRVQSGHEDTPRVGVPIGLGPAGELLLQTATGIERVLSGDVEMAAAMAHTESAPTQT